MTLFVKPDQNAAAIALSSAKLNPRILHPLSITYAAYSPARTSGSTTKRASVQALVLPCFSVLRRSTGFELPAAVIICVVA